jgi:nitrogen regulatory protein PII 1
MKMIRAIIRPEREEMILKKLEEAEIFAMTKSPVLGRGKQKGIQVGKVNYDLLAKVMLVLVVEEEEYPKAVAAIESGGDTGHPGDGKIFVQEVSQSYTIRTGERKSGGIS